MHQLQGMSEEAFDKLVKSNMFGRKVGGFVVKLFCSSSHHTSCELRPYPTYVESTKQFEELVYKKWAAVPYRQFHVWSEGGCDTVGDASTFGGALMTLDPRFSYFVAFSGEKPAAFAQVDPTGMVTWEINYLQSKFGGAGSACLETVGHARESVRRRKTRAHLCELDSNGRHTKSFSGRAVARAKGGVLNPERPARRPRSLSQQILQTARIPGHR
jgi:hypothetical protein